MARVQRNARMLDTTYYKGLNIISEGRPNVNPEVLYTAIPLTPNGIYDASLVDRTYNEVMSLGYF